jgi:hypothetical protein
MCCRSHYTNFGGSLKHKERKLLQGGGYVDKSRSEAEAVARTRAACPHIHRFVRCGLWVTLKRRSRARVIHNKRRSTTGFIITGTYRYISMARELMRTNAGVNA